MYTALKCIFGTSTYCCAIFFMHLCIYHSAIKCTRCNIAQWKECNIVHRVQYSTVLRVQDSAVMGQLGAWVLSHFCGAVQPKPHQWWLFSVQCAVLNISDDCAVCSSEHQLRKVRMILDLGRTVGLLLLDPTTLLTLPPQRGDPLSQSSPFLLVFHLTRTRLNWPLLITVRATFKCLPDPLHYVLKILKFHPLQNQQKLNDSMLISF